MILILLFILGRTDRQGWIKKKAVAAATALKSIRGESV